MTDEALDRMSDRGQPTVDDLRRASESVAQAARQFEEVRAAATQRDPDRPIER